jgi:hypothetical protein
MTSDARNVKGLGDKIEVQIPPDENGFTGHECPEASCEGYFKIEYGTGLKGEGLPCHCPYCGHRGDHDSFYTKAQIEYAKSIAVSKITGALIKDLKRLEFEHKPKPGSFGIGMKMTVSGSPSPIRHYAEKDLETEVVCDQCTLRYAVYGVFAFCPDCKTHNSLQILAKNLELARRQLDLAAKQDDPEMRERLVHEALGSAVAALDGFGRETCRISRSIATAPAKAENISFQNLPRAAMKVQNLFGFDLSGGLSADEWAFAGQCFQKRHLAAHKMGVVDQEYLDATSDSAATLGRKIVVETAEVERLLGLLELLGRHLVSGLTGSGAAGAPGSTGPFPAAVALKPPTLSDKAKRVFKLCDQFNVTVGQRLERGSVSTLLNEMSSQALNAALQELVDAGYLKLLPDGRAFDRLK